LATTALVFLTYLSISSLDYQFNQKVTYDRLGRSHETKESSDHSNKRKEGSSESSSYIWHLLASLNNIESTEIYMSARGAKQ
jgi:hypothetical protein